MSFELALIGGGKIGEALLSGLLRSQLTPGQVCIVENHVERGEYLRDRYGVSVVTVKEAATSSRTLIVAIKPQDVDALLDDLADLVTPSVLVVSVAAGVPTARLEARLPAGTPVVRCMPNTPALVDEAMTAVSAGRHAGPAELERAAELLRAVGRVVTVPESQLDAVTALSGSGPAYFFYLVEAMIDAGILLGLPRALAAELIVQTAVGSAKMLAESGEHPVQLREAVTSPGGTTIAAIRELENHGVRAAFLSAIEAASDRSKVLGAADPGH